MTEISADTSPLTIEFFKRHSFSSFSDANQRLQSLTGIVDFFINQKDFSVYLSANDEKADIKTHSPRRAFGDFQTNQKLAEAVCLSLKNKATSPTTIFEPTFGRGAFILAALKTFPKIKQFYGVEIHQPYVQETKLAILDFFLKNQQKPPQITLFHADIFTFDFKKIKLDKSDNLLILGNPPWIKSSQLSALKAANLPFKVNRKKMVGLQAITGKGDFDLGESFCIDY